MGVGGVWGIDWGGEPPWDCDDERADVYPGAHELCDGADNDCDGTVDNGLDRVTVYADHDGDGAGVDDDTTLACDTGDGWAAVGGDCDDANGAAYPGATEVWYDGIDEDCKGGDDDDADADGDRSNKHGGTDCDDTDPTVLGGQPETWLDYGIDNDCDGDPLGSLTWSSADALTRLDGVVAGGEASKRLAYLPEEDCLFVAAPNVDGGRGVVYAEVGGASGVRQLGGNGVISTTQLGSNLALGLAASSSRWSPCPRRR